MKNLTYETYLADPQAAQEQIELEARRMRTQARARTAFRSDLYRPLQDFEETPL